MSWYVISISLSRYCDSNTIFIHYSDTSTKLFLTAHFWLHSTVHPASSYYIYTHAYVNNFTNCRTEIPKASQCLSASETSQRKGSYSQMCAKPTFRIPECFLHIRTGSPTSMLFRSNPTDTSASSSAASSLTNHPTIYQSTNWLIDKIEKILLKLQSVNASIH